MLASQARAATAIGSKHVAIGRALAVDMRGIDVPVTNQRSMVDGDRVEDADIPADGRAMRFSIVSVGRVFMLIDDVVDVHKIRFQRRGKSVFRELASSPPRRNRVSALLPSPARRIRTAIRSPPAKGTPKVLSASANRLNVKVWLVLADNSSVSAD